MFLRPIIQSLSLRNDEMSRILCALISVLCFRSQKLSLTFLWPGPVTFDTKVAQVSQDLGWALGKYQTSLTPLSGGLFWLVLLIILVIYPLSLEYNYDQVL